MGAGDVFRVDLGVGGEDDEKRLIPHHMGEDPGEKSGFLGGASDPVRRDPGFTEKSSQTVGVLGQKTQGRDANSLCHIVV